MIFTIDALSAGRMNAARSRGFLREKGGEGMIFTIDSAHAGERLDVFLAREGGVTRSRAGALIREGAARVNGSVPRGFLREKGALA